MKIKHNYIETEIYTRFNYLKYIYICAHIKENLSEF